MQAIAKTILTFDNKTFVSFVKFFLCVPLWFKNSYHKDTQRFFTKEHKARHFVLSDFYDVHSISSFDYVDFQFKTLTQNKPLTE